MKSIEEQAKKDGFRLSTGVKVFAALLVALYCAPVFFSDAIPEALGIATADLLIFIGLPLLIAWFAWRVGGRSARGANWTFALLLFIGLSGRNSTNARLREEQQQRLDSALADANGVKARLKETDDPDEIEEISEDLHRSALAFLDELGNATTGDERLFVRALRAILVEREGIETRWGDALDAVVAPDFLDYSLLVNDGVFASRLEAIEEFSSATGAYREYVTEFPPRLEGEAERFDPPSEFIRRAIDAAHSQFDMQMPGIVSVLDATDRMRRAMHELLVLLRDNTDVWSASDEGTVVVDSGELLPVISARIEEINRELDAIGPLSLQVLRDL